MQELLKSLLNIVSRITYAVAKGGQESANAGVTQESDTHVKLRADYLYIEPSANATRWTNIDPNADDINHAQLRRA